VAMNMAKTGALPPTGSVMPAEREDTMLSSVECTIRSDFPIISVNPERVNLKTWTELIVINNCYVKFRMDTGAEVDVIPKSVLDRLFQKKYSLQPRLCLKSMVVHYCVPLVLLS